MLGLIEKHYSRKNHKGIIKSMKGTKNSTYAHYSRMFSNGSFELQDHLDTVISEIEKIITYFEDNTEYFVNDVVNGSGLSYNHSFKQNIESVNKMKRSLYDLGFFREKACNILKIYQESRVIEIEGAPEAENEKSKYLLAFALNNTDDEIIYGEEDIPKEIKEKYTLENTQDFIDKIYELDIIINETRENN